MAIADGFRADVESLRDFLRCSRFDQQAQNFEFPHRQCFQGNTFTAKLFQRQRLGDVGTQKAVTCIDIMDRTQQYLRRTAFGDVPPGGKMFSRAPENAQRETEI